MTPQEAYDQLSFYTLAKQDEDFIHQNIVDAFACQYADENTKPIKLAFGLMGLYLTLEKGYTGRMVQIAHKTMAEKNKDKNWPKFPHKKREFEMSVFDVLGTSPGVERDGVIRQWCQAVWEGYADCQQEVRDWLKRELDI